MRAGLAAQLRRDGVLVAAAGAITPAQLRAILPELLGALPAGAPDAPPSLPAFTEFGRQVLPVPSPQSQIILASPASPRTMPIGKRRRSCCAFWAGAAFPRA